MTKTIETETVVSKRPRVITTDIQDGVLTFRVAGVDEPIDLDSSSLTADITREAMLHGLRQKVSDAAALGAAATPDDKWEAMKAIVDSLILGNWSQRSSDGTGPQSGLIFRAFYQFACERAESTKKPLPDREQVKALYSAKSRSDQLALRKVARIAEIMDEMRAATAANVSEDDLFAELGL